MNLRTSYDRVADDYVLRIYDELRHKPLDRRLLESFAESVGGKGLCCDLGCGPGQVAKYLHDLGVPVCGIDLSEEMVRRAQALNPGITFQQGDMAKMNVPEEHFVGVVAFYSLIHIAPSQMGAVLREIRRVLVPGGMLFIAFHIGDELVHLDEWWGHAVDVDFHFFPPVQMRTWLEETGFVVEETTERDPYPEVEHQSRRAYMMARRREAPV